MSPSISKLQALLKEELGQLVSLSKLAGDASFRTYYRINTEKKSFVLMDSSNDNSIDIFTPLTNFFSDHNIRVPKIYAHLPEQGYLILEDFGDTLYSKITESEQVDYKYKSAINTLVDIESIPLENCNLPRFTPEFLKMQFDLFSDWFITSYLNINNQKVVKEFSNLLLPKFEKIIENAPKVVVHMDYHSRNLISVDDNSPGVIDFQDARIGPIGYDAVSLWQDAYRVFSDEQIESWANYYLEQLLSKKSFPSLSKDELMHFVYWTGLQRHIKNLGIFARLKIKYKKDSYEKSIPQLLSYINQIAEYFPEIYSLNVFLQESFYEFSNEQNDKVQS